MADTGDTNIKWFKLKVKDRLMVTVMLGFYHLRLVFS